MTIRAMLPKIFLLYKNKTIIFVRVSWGKQRKLLQKL